MSQTNSQPNSQTKGIICLCVCAMLWSTAGVLIKIIPWNAMVIGSLRSLIAAVVIFLALPRRKDGLKLPTTNRNTLQTGVMLGTTCALFVCANKLTTAANAIVLQSANPVFVVIFCGIIYHQRFSRRDIAVVFITLTGVILFFLDELSPGSFLGNIMAIISAITLAATFISATKAQSLGETMSGVFYGHCFAGLVGLPFIFIYPPTAEPTAVAAILFLGVFQLGLPYILFSHGARVCSPLVISLVGMLEPTFNPILVAIFLKEVPGPLALVGGATVLITLFLWCVSNSKRAATKND